MSTLDKYKKITKESSKSADNEILVSNKGDPIRHITYGTALLREGGKKTLIVKASGAAMARAVKVAIYLRKRVPGVALITKITNREVVDEYEPLEEGLDKVVVNRKMVVLEITCSTEPLDTKDPGYKGPITQAEIESEKAYIERRRKESTGSNNKVKKNPRGKGNDKEKHEKGERRERKDGEGKHSGSRPRGERTDKGEKGDKGERKHFEKGERGDHKPRGNRGTGRGGRRGGGGNRQEHAKPVETK